MKPRDIERAAALRQALLTYSGDVQALPGLSSPANVETLVAQLLDSLRRVEFAKFIVTENFDECRADPTSVAFDPLRAAVYFSRKGDQDEAIWLVFLFVHCGRHPKDGYRLVRDIYGNLGVGLPWSWKRVSANADAFHDWLRVSYSTLAGGDGVSRQFGGHRSYETLDPNSINGTAVVVRSLVDWITKNGTLPFFVRAAHQTLGQDPKVMFDHLYRTFRVYRFGRLGRFDFLTMLGKLGLLPVEAPSAYVVPKSGPSRGIQLLFRGNAVSKIGTRELNTLLMSLDQFLGVGPQVLEDALCNWQKSPAKYKYFRG